MSKYSNMRKIYIFFLNYTGLRPLRRTGPTNNQIQIRNVPEHCVCCYYAWTAQFEGSNQLKDNPKRRTISSRDSRDTHEYSTKVDSRYVAK